MAETAEAAVTAEAAGTDQKELETMTKKLVYAGIDAPSVDPRGPSVLKGEALASQLERLQTLPFDGILVNVRDPKFPWPQTLLGNNLFGPHRHEFAAFAPVVPQLRTLKQAPQLTDNFFLIATSYWFETGKNNPFDWFDDKRWATVENNLRVFARLAREAGTIRGFLVDVETYSDHKPGVEPDWGYHIFSTNHLYNLVNKLPGNGDPRGAYRAKVRERGRQFFRALDESLPGAPLLFYLGYGLALEKTDFASDLLPRFLDGILEEIAARRSQSRVIDGWEAAYKYRVEDEYKAGRNAIRTQLRGLSEVPDLYDKYVRVGFGKWIDAGQGATSVFNAGDAAKNFYAPPMWETSLRLALKHTDEYVWIWGGGQGRVFPMAHGRAANVPAPYLGALRRAKQP